MPSSECQEFYDLDGSRVEWLGNHRIIGLRRKAVRLDIGAFLAMCAYPDGANGQNSKPYAFWVKDLRTSRQPQPNFTSWGSFPLNVHQYGSDAHEDQETFGFVIHNDCLKLFNQVFLSLAGTRPELSLILRTFSNLIPPRDAWRTVNYFSTLNLHDSTCALHGDIINSSTHEKRQQHIAAKTAKSDPMYIPELDTVYSSEHALQEDHNVDELLCRRPSLNRLREKQLGMDSRSSLESLPYEIKEAILGFLPLSSVRNLRIASRAYHVVVLGNLFWRSRLLQHQPLFFDAPDQFFNTISTYDWTKFYKRTIGGTYIESSHFSPGLSNRRRKIGACQKIVMEYSKEEKKQDYVRKAGSIFGRLSVTCLGDSDPPRSLLPQVPDLRFIPDSSDRPVDRLQITCEWDQDGYLFAISIVATDTEAGPDAGLLQTDRRPQTCVLRTYESIAALNYTICSSPGAGCIPGAVTSLQFETSDCIIIEMIARPSAKGAKTRVLLIDCDREKLFGLATRSQYGIVHDIALISKQYRGPNKEELQAGFKAWPHPPNVEYSYAASRGSEHRTRRTERSAKLACPEQTIISEGICRKYLIFGDTEREVNSITGLYMDDKLTAFQIENNAASNTRLLRPRIGSGSAKIVYHNMQGAPRISRVIMRYGPPFMQLSLQAGSSSHEVKSKQIPVELCENDLECYDTGDCPDLVGLCITWRVQSDKSLSSPLSIVGLRRHLGNDLCYKQLAFGANVS